MPDKHRKKGRKSSSRTKQNVLRRKGRSHLPAKKKTASFSKNKGKQKGGEKVKPSLVTGRRLWLFRVIAVTVIPVLLLLLLEISLRLVGYGFPTTITIKDKINDELCYYNNTKFAWRFFHPNIARTTEPFVFPVNKSENTYRIFVMGASAVAGTPDATVSDSKFRSYYRCDAGHKFSCGF